MFCDTGNRKGDCTLLPVIQLFALIGFLRLSFTSPKRVRLPFPNLHQESLEYGAEKRIPSPFRACLRFERPHAILPFRRTRGEVIRDNFCVSIPAAF